MQVIKSTYSQLTMVGLILSTMLITGIVTAQDSMPLQFSMLDMPGEIIGSNQIHRKKLSFDTNELVYVVPANVYHGKNQEAIRITTKDDECLIALRLLTTTTNELSNQLNTLVSQQFPANTNLENVPLTILGQSGSGYRFNNQVANLTQIIYVYLVPTSMCIFEITLYCMPKSENQALAVLNEFLLSFQSNAQGPIIIKPRSEAS